MGFRFRLHRRKLPGRPDIVLPKYRSVIFVNGCYWHRNLGCRFAYSPKSRVEFWEKKFAENVVRDRKNVEALEVMGRRVLTVWECEIEDGPVLVGKLKEFLMVNEQQSVVDGSV